MFDASDAKTNQVLNVMMHNGRNVKYGMRDVKAKEIITDVSLVDCSDFEHVSTGVSQYGLHLYTKLVGFEDQLHHEVSLLRENGTPATEIDFDDRKALNSDSEVIYKLNTQEINRLNDAGLYDDPVETLRDLQLAMQGREFECESAVRMTTFTVEGHDFQIGADRSKEPRKLDCGLVSSMNTVINLDADVEEQTLSDCLNDSILAVVSQEQLRKQAKRDKEARQEIENKVQLDAYQPDLADENDDEMHMHVGTPLDLKAPLEKQDEKVEETEEEPIENLNVDAAVDLGQTTVSLDKKDDESTATLSEKSDAPSSFNGKSDAEVRREQMKRLREQQQEERKRKKQHQQAVEEAISDDDDKSENEADKIANENLGRKIQTEHADDIDSSLTDDNGEQFNDDISQFESEDEERKRHRNEKEFETKRVAITEPDGPEHQKQREEDNEIKKKKRAKVKTQDGPEL